MSQSKSKNKTIYYDPLGVPWVIASPSDARNPSGHTMYRRVNPETMLPLPTLYDSWAVAVLPDANMSQKSKQGQVVDKLVSRKEELERIVKQEEEKIGVLRNKLKLLHGKQTWLEKLSKSGCDKIVEKFRVWESDPRWGVVFSRVQVDAGNYFSFPSSVIDLNDHAQTDGEGSCRIQAGLPSNFGGTSMRLISLFGASDGNLEWGINDWRDGSGIWKSIQFCKDAEEVHEMFISSMGKLMDLVDEKGIAFPQYDVEQMLKFFYKTLGLYKSVECYPPRIRKYLLEFKEKLLLAQVESSARAAENAKAALEEHQRNYVFAEKGDDG